MLFSIGHSNRTLDEFVAILKAHEIGFVADIRGGKASSRAFPHFDNFALGNALPKRGVMFKRIETLGGRRGRSLSVDPSVNDGWRLAAFHNYADYAFDSVAFDNGVRELIALGKKHRVAFMCSEAVPWRCHRSIVTDYLLLVHNIPVTHLIGVKQTLEGKPHTFAKKSGRKVIYPSGQGALF